VVRVAKILKQHFKTSEAAAVAEATNMAVTDGLYSKRQGLVRLLEPEGGIGLNVRGMFAKAAQDKPELRNGIGMGRMSWL
jgi:hypothetical protein